MMMISIATVTISVIQHRSFDSDDVDSL